MNPLAFCLVAFCTLQRISCDSTTDNDALLVQTDKGWVRGVMQDSAIAGEKQFMGFKGIPYAKPPIGDLRFKAPEEAESWDEERDATEFGPECLQYNSQSKNVTGCEDCLNINVFTPTTTSTNLPVAFIMSGFAYAYDFDKSMYGPDMFMARNMVMVTFNYRLGALGFLSLDTKDVPGNAGMRDQVLALKWVQKNIEKFGGDPKNVTIIGTSCGSSSAVHHMASDMSKGLFKNVVLISGVPTVDPIYPFRINDKSYALARSVGCKNNSELLSCLQKIEINEELLKNKWSLLASEKVNNILWKKMAQFVPKPEKDLGQERFLDDSTITKIKNGYISKEVKVMVGYASHEGLFVVKESVEYMMAMYNEYLELFVPNRISYSANSYTTLETAKNIRDHYFSGYETIDVENLPQFIDMISMASMVHHVGIYIDILSTYLDTHVFKFSCQSNRNYFGLQGKQYGINGTSHGDSLFYMFNPDPIEWNWTVETETPEYKMINQFMDAITNFAKTGNPTPNADSDNAWPLYTPDSQSYLEFSDTTEVKVNPEKEAYEFWVDIYAKANVTV